MTVRSMYVYNGASWDEVGYTIAHGVPAGGASGTILAKSSATDYDTAWIKNYYVDESVGRRIFAWDSINSRYQMTYGDTGIRDVTADLVTSDGFTGITNLELRRVGNLVQLQGVTLTRAAPGVGDKTFYTLPAGFTPDQTTYIRTAVSNCFGYALVSDGKVYIRTAATSDGFSFSWMTTAAWPTVLPGSARGSIPSA